MVSEAPDPALELAHELRPVLLRLNRELRRETEQLGVTSTQATLLRHVRASPGLGLGELAELEGISAPSLSGHVNRLEEAGLARRVRDPADRRRVGLELTAPGERLLRRVRARRTTWLAARLRSLDDRDLRAVARALPALQRLVEEERP